MTAPRKLKINIGDAKAEAVRNSNVSPERLAIERMLAELPRDDTLTLDQIAARIEITPRVARQRLQQMRHELLAVNAAPRGTASRWRLSANGRRALLGEEAWRAEEAKAKAEQERPATVAGGRLYIPPKAARGTLSPWHGGNPVRDGAMVAFALPSRGIKA
jgi:hypothetical protein